MEKRNFLSKFYVIAGYYSTSGRDIGSLGRIPTRVKAAFIIIFKNFYWILPLLLLLILAYLSYKIIRKKIEQYKRSKELDKVFAVVHTPFANQPVNLKELTSG